ncbi:TniQ family protein [Paraoerskovia marina]|uniref:TniQ family protein n=1 Tax=Paraoerskovia marina TaxID=545619 RepID=UPI0009DDF5B8
MRPLPVRYAPDIDQPIDDWLEHLAHDNGMSSSALCTMIRQGGGTTRFLPVLLDEATATAMGILSATTSESLYQATLMRFDGIGAIDLTGLDPRRAATWRRVAARGWIAAAGSTACPTCLETRGIWRLAWRLPMTTTCTVHGNYLLDGCPRCGRPFLQHPHTPLRVAPGTRCLNPIGHRDTCEQNIADLQPAAAPSEVMSQQTRYRQGLSGRTVNELGKAQSGSAFISDTRSLTVLLLHLASRPGAEDLADWVDTARDEASRGVDRWHLHPPATIRLRSAVLASVDEILSAPTLEQAAAQLGPWLAMIPTNTQSRDSWIRDHTSLTPGLVPLLKATCASRRRISFSLISETGRFVPNLVPQVLPVDLYRKYAEHLFNTRGHTPRLFLSLCLARRAGANTWAQAAEMLRLPPEVGTRAARAVSTRTVLDPLVVGHVLDRITRHLGIDYRRREAVVTELATKHAWFSEWCTGYRPGTRETSHPYAVTWLWECWAHALLTQSPTRPPAHSRYQRVLYRQFANSLREPAQSALIAKAHRAQHEENQWTHREISP